MLLLVCSQSPFAGRARHGETGHRVLVRSVAVGAVVGDPLRVSDLLHPCADSVHLRASGRAGPRVPRTRRAAARDLPDIMTKPKSNIWVWTRNSIHLRDMVGAVHGVWPSETKHIA